MSEPWPEEIRLKPEGRTLQVRYDNGEAFDYSAELLRVESPSAEVKGHGPGQEVTVAGKQAVRIIKIDPVGNYAVRLSFDDGHATGLYTWAYLLKLGREQPQIWARYLEKLSAQGLKRSQG
jgi:DUF971 family protein